MTAPKKVKHEVIKTLYFDKADVRFVYLVWNKTLLKGQPHKMPRTVHTEADAHKYIKEHKL